MIRHRFSSVYFILVVLFLLSFTLVLGQFGTPVLAGSEAEVVAQEEPDPTQPPPTLAPTPVPPPPAEIPEPITVILFGTGLAALSAAAARRKKTE